MRPALQNWINLADNERHLKLFSIVQTSVHLAEIATRYEDYYISLVSELFENLNSQEQETPKSDWAQIGNALLQFSAETTDEQLYKYGVSRSDATHLAAAAFYFGDFPASACLTMKRNSRPDDNDSFRAACFDFLARPAELRSPTALQVRELIVSGDAVGLNQLIKSLGQRENEALQIGPESWIAAKLLNELMARFSKSNIRAVLPDGYSDFWAPLVRSFVDRRPPTWEFFPSQIEAIQADFLTSDESYSLQMPTSAGKTTLCETLLFKFLKSHPDDVAVMLVPYRSLAAELKGTLIRRLNAVGLASRCAYGGTVPTGDEIHDLATTRAIVATPEALTGLIGADLVFAKRIGLIICDEGHLLDGGERGIGLELLLARLRARQDRPTRFVFMSAIVPNIEEINAWLGGTDQTVLRSTYRPAIAEFAVLKPLGSGNNTVVGMDMHPHEVRERRFSIDQFLNKNDFEFRNPATRRINTYNFESKKTQVIATARRALSMGCTAIFAMNKTGPQGAIGIAESLVAQLQNELPLPKPINFTHPDVLRRTVAYLEDEYTAEWIGTVSVKNGAVLHHGDIPQETREVLESLIRNENVKLIICTSTLAEGVNLPVRTLILYSVERRNNDSVQNMLARDIKNLVGRAGRAGVNTKGLVICANYEQWRYVQPVAMHGAGEPVKGALFDFINLLTDVLLHNNIQLSNEFMEEHSEVFPVIDGVDATLIELLSNEIGEEEFVAIATNLAAQTFAARQLSEASAENLRSIFALRARNLIALRSGGKTAWARETGAKARLIGSVELNLLPLRADWQVEVDPLSDEARSIIFQWAWDHVSLREKMTKCFRLKEGVDPETVKDTFFEVARLWMSGMQFKEIASLTNLPMDDLLAVHCLGITFSLQTLVEQGFSLLAKRLESEGVALAEGFVNFSEHLRFGCPSAAARMLAASGVRHRKAYVKLGEFLQSAPGVVNQSDAKGAASATMRQYYDHWRGILGDLVYQNTLSDLSA